MLQRGTVGEAVVVLQHQLAQLLRLPIREDGLFGPQTQAAVKAFQQLSGLPISGVVDNETAATLTKLSGFGQGLLSLPREEP